MRPAFGLTLLYLAVCAAILLCARSCVHTRYAAQRTLAINHRVVEGDFVPLPDDLSAMGFLRTGVRKGEQVTEDAFASAPIATPAKGKVLIGFERAGVPGGSDAGDSLSLCGAKGPATADVELAALDCTPGTAPRCSVLIQAAPGDAVRILGETAKQANIRFSPLGSCKAAPAPKKAVRKTHRAWRAKHHYRSAYHRGY